MQDRNFQFNMTLGGVVIVPFIGLDLGYIASGFIVLRLSRRGMSVSGRASPRYHRRDPADVGKHGTHAAGQQ